MVWLGEEVGGVFVEGVFVDGVLFFRKVEGNDVYFGFRSVYRVVGVGGEGLLYVYRYGVS